MHPSKLLFLSAVLSVFSLHTARPAEAPSLPAADARSKFQEARAALTGEHKDTERAKRLLGEVVAGGKALDEDTLCYAFVYLGYLEDRAKNREEASAWYRKALTLKAGQGILDVARYGLQKPVTWIRHLDAGSMPGGRLPPRPPPPGKGFVTTADPPTGLLPDRTLTAGQQRENFEFLWDAIDRNYAMFQLKSIDWAEVGRRYRTRLDAIQDTDEFYRLLFQLVRELGDSHSGFQNHRPFFPAHRPALAVDLFEGRPFVTDVVSGSEPATLGIVAGSEILEVDGFTASAAIERTRPFSRGFSSDRAFRRSAAQSILAGVKDSTATVKLRTPAGEVVSVDLKRSDSRSFGTSGLAVPFPLTRQEFVHFGRHPAGPGYVRIVSFAGRQAIDDEFDRALEALKDAPGLILDIRDNPGGFGHPAMAGRFLRDRKLATISYTRSGPAHGDLARREFYLEPTGTWRYRRPVALLVNDVTGSAADLFATYLRAAGQVVTIGSTTHGNLSGVAALAVLPCGLVVRISNGYVCDAKGRPVEVNGNRPDIAISPTIADFLAGRDPVLSKAAEVVMERSRTAKQPASEAAASAPASLAARSEQEFRQGRHLDALKSAEEALRRDSRNTAAKMLRAEANYALGDREKARAGLLELIEQEPELEEARLSLGRIELAAGNARAAEREFSAALAIRPSDSRGTLGLAEAYLAQKRGGEAIGLIQADLKKQPGNRQLQHALASVAARAGNYEIAIECYQGLIAREPASADLLVQLGRAYEVKGDTISAMGSFRKAMELAPQNVSVILPAALALERAGSSGEARPLYEEILKIDPGNVLALNNLAYILAESGSDLDRALNLALAAESKAPRDRNLMDTVGWIYVKLNRNGEAAGIFRQLVADSPGNMMFQYHFGVALFQSGDKAGARQALEAALARNPGKRDEAKIRELLGRLN